MCITEETETLSAESILRDQLFQVLILEIRMFQYHTAYLLTKPEPEPIYPDGAIWTLSDKFGLDHQSFITCFRAILAQPLCQALKRTN